MFPEKNQYYAVICANLITFNYGITVGWPSASLPILSADDTPLKSGPLSLFEASSIGSIICIGGIIGQLLYRWIADKYGRKPGMMLVAVPSAIHWLMIAFGNDFYTLLFARLICGMTAGGVFQVIPLIVSEIASIGIRGRLGSFLILFTNAGTVFAYVICSYLSYRTVPWVCIALVLLFAIGFWIVPETPKFLMLQGKEEEAEKAMQFFNGRDSNMKIIQMKTSSYESDTSSADEEIVENNQKCSLMKLDAAAKRGLILGIFLISIVMFSGLFTFANYYEMIFSEAGSNLSPALSSIIVGSIQLLGTMSASTVIERAGRKPLILISAYGCVACVTIMGIHSMLKDLDVDVSAFNWIPLVCLSLLVFIAANGAQSVPYVVLGEIFAQNVRGTLIAVCLIASWIISFLLILIFPFMIEYLKMYGALWIFAGVEFFCATVVWVMMPETKGVSIEKIVQILGKNK